MSMYDKNQYNIVNISLQLIKINEKKKKKKGKLQKGMRYILSNYQRAWLRENKVKPSVQLFH